MIKDQMVNLLAVRDANKGFFSNYTRDDRGWHCKESYLNFVACIFDFQLSTSFFRLIPLYKRVKNSCDLASALPHSHEVFFFHTDSLKYYTAVGCILYRKLDRFTFTHVRMSKNKIKTWTAALNNNPLEEDMDNHFYPTTNFLSILFNSSVASWNRVSFYR